VPAEIKAMQNAGSVQNKPELQNHEIGRIFFALQTAHVLQPFVQTAIVCLGVN
jgi:hypothetical protein